MADIEQVLAMLAEEEDAPNYLVIDNDLRTVTIPEGIKLLGVEHDKEVQRLHFVMPCTCGDVNLEDFQIRINYINALGKGDIYVVDDKEVREDAITFSWLVGRQATVQRGAVSFIVCAKLSEGEVVLKEFNTRPITLPVLEGLEIEQDIEQEYPDVLEGILKRLDDLEQAAKEQLPVVDEEDVGKFLRVSSEGAWVAETVASASGVSF